MLIDDGRLREQAGRWVFSGTADVLSVPGNVSSLLGARLDRLGATELRVVESASVIGLEFATSALSVLLEESVAEADLERALAALCRKQLIRRAEPGEADDFHFSHILVRDTAYARLLKRTRARLHERFAAWFTGTVGSRVAEYEEIIGYHLEQSFRYRAELGPIDDDGRRLGAEASRHLSSAGRRALARGDMPAAATLLQRAAALLGDKDPARALLLLDAGEATVDIGEFEQAESVLTEAVERALSAGDTGTARAAALALLQLRYTTDAHAVQESIGRQESMVELVELEIPELEAMGHDRALVRAFRLLTAVYGTGGRFADAAAAAERAIRHATAAGDQVTARRFLGSLAISALYGSMPVVEAIATCEEVLARAQDDRKARALTELCIGHLEAMRGDFERARLLYRRSRASLEEFGYLHYAALTSLDSSVIELLAGDLATAESELRTDYRRLEEMGERNYISTTAGLLADVLYRQGRYGESAEFAGTCEHLASPDDVASQFLWRCVRGKLSARQGAIGEAESLLSAAMALIESSDQLDLQGNGLLDFAEVRELAGAPADAAALSEQAASLRPQGERRLGPTSTPARRAPALDASHLVGSWQVHDHAIVSCEDADGCRRVLRDEGVDFGIGTPRVVVKERALPGVDALRQCDRVLNSRMAEKSQPRQLGRGVLGIVHEQVGVLAQHNGGVVKDAGAVRAGTEGNRAVIRKVSQRAGTVAEPVTERAAAFVRDLQRVHREALESIVPGLNGVEGPAVAELLGPDREMRRRTRRGQQFLRLLDRQEVHVDPAARERAAAEERQAVRCPSAGG